MSTKISEDPVIRSLRSIIAEVNEVSDRFKAGHKWNCNDPYNHLHPHRGAIMAARNGRRLVRQAATTSSENHTIVEDDLKVRVHPSSPDNAQSAAFLLRPVSRISNASSVLLSPGGGGEDKKRLLLGDLQPRHSSTTRSMEYFPPKSKVRLSSSSANRRQLLKKQKTSDSAPPSRYYSGSSAYLFRQSSCASGNATLAPPPHYPHLSPSSGSQGITLVRGASCSLVDIPTYLGPSVGVELAQSVVRASKSASSGRGDGIIEKKLVSTPRPRLQLDLTKKQRSLTTRPTKKKKSSGKKTQWTVLCVSLTLLTMCVTLVGTMLSVGSQYPEMLIARRWDQILNESRILDKDELLNGTLNRTMSIILPSTNDSSFISSSSFNHLSSSNRSNDSILLTSLLSINQNKGVHNVLENP
ncbi:uncharacterized protein [Lepeophtheirus salmonis]|uniref:uncharacterized protein n=1 Tax=Lepeophtheirus salmonis TaxID=72036 RepID=UPI001AEB5A63|nr:uncharacterized protein LOC121120182 [Lepeophtheirus salmonis]XP_040570969.1 uncharacterized protein LOC121120182 [Lepeophtheirus salmonis]